MAPLIFQLLNAPGAPLINWREIIKEVEAEFAKAETSERRASLLNVFSTTMNAAETTVAAEDLETFREARKKHYKLFIVQEALVGEVICVETLDEVTRREISAGRMSPDDRLREIAEQGMAEPHLSRAELLKPAISSVAPVSRWRRAWDRFIG